MAVLEDRKKNTYDSRCKSVIAEQKHYSSVTAFCNYYGLKYTSVQYYLRKGLTGDEVLSILQQKPASSRYLKKAPGRAVSVKIGEDVFQSLSEAALAYGVSITEIEKAMIAGDATPAFLNMEPLNEIDRKSERMKPCVIAGVHYPSQAAAAREYGIPIVTIYSRMQREGISFEEAIRRGNIERRHIIAEETKWSGVQAFVPVEEETENMKFTNEIISLLARNCYRPELLRDKKIGSYALRIQECLTPISAPLDIYILFNEQNTAQNIEFIFPVLGTVRILSDEKQMLLYQQMNELNRKYIGSKIFLQDGNFSAVWTLPQASKIVQATFFMRTLYRFVGATSAMWDVLKWADKGLERE